MGSQFNELTRMDSMVTQTMSEGRGLFGVLTPGSSQFNELARMDSMVTQTMSEGRGLFGVLTPGSSQFKNFLLVGLSVLLLLFYIQSYWDVTIRLRFRLR